MIYRRVFLRGARISATNTGRFSTDSLLSWPDKTNWGHLLADPASCGRFVGALANLGSLSAGNWAFVGCCRGISLAADICSGQGHRRPVLAAYVISHNDDYVQ